MNRPYTEGLPWAVLKDQIKADLNLVYGWRKVYITKKRVIVSLPDGSILLDISTDAWIGPEGDKIIAQRKEQDRKNKEQWNKILEAGFRHPIPVHHNLPRPREPPPLTPNPVNLPKRKEPPPIKIK